MCQSFTEAGKFPGPANLRDRIKGQHTREVHEFADYKEYVVSTEIKPVN